MMVEAQRMELLRMPRASENMVEGTLGLWLAKEGDRAVTGAPVVEVITEKAQFELECESSGILVRQFAATRATVPTGFILAVISAAGESPDLSSIERENQDILQRHLSTAFSGVPAAPGTAVVPKSEARVSATPRARKLARDLNVSLEEVKAVLNLEGIIEERHVQQFVDSRDNG
jgi:pyruvate/2-oxoglutarate dehydrogenase complex dihydrolipoamide acyltransferase (E2) component